MKKMFVTCRTTMPIYRVARIMYSRCCVLHQFPHYTRLQTSVLPSVRHCSVGSEALASPSRDGEAKEYPQKITQLVDQIADLTLLEVADLNELLKKTLKIQDAPVMAAGMAVAAPAQQQEEEEEEEEAPAQQVQTSFTVKLVKFDAASKVKLIKQIKAVSADMNLVQAKKFVESVPAVVKADIGKDEAEKLKEEVEAAGGTCEIE